MLHHAALLIVGLLDEEAVVLDGRSGRRLGAGRRGRERNGEERETGRDASAQASHSRAMPSRSHALRPAITMATRYASTASQPGLANSPIFARSTVNSTSGNTANESWRLRITWLRMSSFAVPLSPYDARSR